MWDLPTAPAGDDGIIKRNTADRGMGTRDKRGNRGRFLIFRETDRMDEKKQVEFRYYDIPKGDVVFPLTGETWHMEYGEGRDKLHFHKYYEVGMCYAGEMENREYSAFLSYKRPFGRFRHFWVFKFPRPKWTKRLKNFF